MLDELFMNRRADFPAKPTELRVQRNTTRNAALISGNLVSNAKAVASGVSARVYDRGVYGFASGADMSDESVKKILAAAADNAVFLGSRAGNSVGDLPPLAPGNEKTAKIDTDVPQKLLLDFAKELDEYIAGKYKNLSGRSVAVNCLDMEKLFMSNDAGGPVRMSHSLVPRAIIGVNLTVNDADGAPVSLGMPYGGYGFFTDLFRQPSQLYKDIDDQFEKLMQKAEGVYPEAGYKKVILGPDMAGILAHEAIGHTVEADLVLGGSVARNYMNKPIASELVTLVDFAHTALGGPVPVPVVVDDEGIEAKDAVIIENGILRSYMHNRFSAKKMGYEPTGNARAFQFSDEPLIRMRNTAVLPGKSKLADLIASVDDGYYLVRTGNGQADTTSEFMFSVTFGYEIKNGKLGRAIKDTTISGVAFDMLKTVDMVSDDMVWSGSGMCGKKQPIPTGMGGPAIKCMINIGGR
ncbi:MAG: TldD/PmbA family protein [Clostridiales bacterium]|jgi:TldD protein|nr:TldD/PmbA family protein [Clostridiales bacterium]